MEEAWRRYTQRIYARNAGKGVSDDIDRYRPISSGTEEETEPEIEREVYGADKPPRASRFTPPTVDEVAVYCQERGNCGRTLETFVKALGKTLPISCDCDMVMKGMSPSVKWWHALVLLRFTVTFSPYNLRTDLYGFSNIFLILSRYVHIAREFKVLDLLACVAPDMIFHAVISCHA